jgi:histidinol-phosphate aminotransferase
LRTVILDPGTGFTADVEQIVEAVRRGPRLCVICNPNNPTGSVIPRAGLLRIVDAAAPDTLVLLDEAYIDYRPDDSLFADVPEHRNLAVVRTFSKAYAMAGLRVGFAAIGEGFRRAFDEYGRPPWPVNLLGLRAAEVALEDDDFIRQRVVECNQLKDQLILGLLAPAIQSYTNYFLIDLAHRKLGAVDLLEGLRSQGVFLREFSGFSALWPDRFARITVQSAPNNDRISILINNFIA